MCQNMVSIANKKLIGLSHSYLWTTGRVIEANQPNSATGARYIKYVSTNKYCGLSTFNATIDRWP